MIDEESRFPRATDFTLVDKLNANFSNSPLYIRSKSSFSSSSISSSSSPTPQSVPSFSIMHFAGQVQYDARGFLEKNRDYLAPEIIHILRSSRVQLISSLFQSSPSKVGTLHEHEATRCHTSAMDNNFDFTSTLSPLNANHNRVQATVSTYFRYSLTDLFSKMVHGSPKFVRCFKPNNERLPGCFDTQTVLEQLKYSGILAGSFRTALHAWGIASVCFQRRRFAVSAIRIAFPFPCSCNVTASWSIQPRSICRKHAKPARASCID